jgi:hypothetical protein
VTSLLPIVTLMALLWVCSQTVGCAKLLCRLASLVRGIENVTGVFFLLLCYQSLMAVASLHLYKCN